MVHQNGKKFAYPLASRDDSPIEQTHSPGKRVMLFLMVTKKYILIKIQNRPFFGGHNTLYLGGTLTFDPFCLDLDWIGCLKAR